MPSVIPPVVGHDDEFFWKGVAEGRLLVQRCSGCATLRHPPSPMCPTCGSLEWEPHPLSGRGTVFSWIVSRHPTQPDDEPRIVVLVSLVEGLRLIANLQGVEAADVRNDMAVEVSFEEVDGVMLPQFRPVAAVAS